MDVRGYCPPAAWRRWSPPSRPAAPPSTQPAEPGDPGAEAPFDEPERPVAAAVDPEVLPDDGEGADLAVADGEVAPPVVAVVVTTGRARG